MNRQKVQSEPFVSLGYGASMPAGLSPSTASDLDIIVDPDCVSQSLHVSDPPLQNIVLFFLFILNSNGMLRP